MVQRDVSEFHRGFFYRCSTTGRALTCTPNLPQLGPPDTRHGPPGHWIPDAGWAPWCTPDCPPVLKRRPDIKRRPDRGWGDTDDAPRTENLTKLSEYSIPCIRPACIRVQLAGGLRDSNGPSLLVLTGHPTPTRLRAHQLSPKKKERKRTTWRWCFDVTGISSTSLCSIPHFPTAPIQSMRVLGRPQGHQAIWRMRDDGLDKEMSYPCHLLSRAPRLREPGSVQDGRRGELLFLACSPGLAWAAWHSTMSIEAISTLQSAAKSMSCDSLGGIPR